MLPTAEVGVWMGLRGFGHDDAVLADYVLLNDPTADSDGAVNCTMAVTDFARYFTGRAIALRPKPRDTEANRPRRVPKRQASLKEEKLLSGFECPEDT